MQPNPQTVANLNEFVSITEHKERYFEERFEPLTSTVLLLLFFVLWKSIMPHNCLVPIVLQNIFLCVQQQKETHSGLQQLEAD